MSGPHVFAVRLRRLRQSRRPRPPHPRPALLTLRNAPLSGTGFRKYRSDLGRAQVNNSEKRNSFLQIVVPAKAGTHTPRRMLLEKEEQPTARETTKAGGYGSLLSQGRQLCARRAAYPLLRLDVGGFQHRPPFF